MTIEFNPTSETVTPYLFFTGKGGVGKTSTACATAVALADEGKQVLIVSTDPASNLQDVFEVEIGYETTSIPTVPGLSAINLDPEEAAAAYREKVVGPYKDKLPAPVIAQMEEQLSGACTVEIAAFDEFASILTNPERTSVYDHIIFDTAPTGHTLRLLQLPTAWSSFLEDSTHGASCLGPLSGLGEKKELYAQAVNALSNAKETTLVLVSRPDESALQEASRAATELQQVGLSNQLLLVNGKLQTYVKEDSVSSAFYERQEKALAQMPNQLRELVTYELPYVPYQLTGIDNLRSLFTNQHSEQSNEESDSTTATSQLKDLIQQVGSKKQGVIMTMGKGGVGKTTVAAAIAVGLAELGHSVHLTTTDPAEQLSYVLGNQVQGSLTVSRIDPKAEVEAYKDEVLSKARETVDENGLAYLEEDLNSPCTEEIAVFRAFADVVEKAKDSFVVIDTAPTGHTLLLLDAAQSYHKELERATGEVPESVTKLLPRLRNEKETDVVIVTLPEATPVHEATRLQDDLARAEIQPSWWVINQSFAATNTTDPVLKARSVSEMNWINLVAVKKSKQVAVIPWQLKLAIGYEQLKKLTI
ncbi:arsenical pump-driving ATPase [Halalkalibacter wakoensis JCM 9140]|uniref:Arsenical pump-driving ATPase n=1 Tax=Halalkalibacter wakoensis JCM 9140 TaxID=1236970 RepID=W4Q6J8_9BACI|nr:arsenical pump-driving ATPase [Halalkalibacter wakoensis]GAE27696.1 arsenical pump-driving ATPase [Halalkalibacter wakoensis JCM 9140]